jgi:hypothetical protein
MQPVFKSPYNRASSASVESDFSHLKNIVLQNEKLPLRVDKFISLHLQALRGSTKEAVNTEIGTEEMDDNEDEKEHLVEELMEEECWRNKNEDFAKREKSYESSVNVDSQYVHQRKEKVKRRRRKRTYLDSYPNIIQIIDHPKKGKTLGVLKNGNCMKPVKLNGVTYVVHNTCPFDSLLQCLSAIYVDYETYREFVNSSRNSFLNFVLYFVLNGANQEAYKKRAELLLNFTGTSVLPSGFLCVNAESSIANITEKHLSDIPSAMETYTCRIEGCNNNRQKHSVFWPVNLNDLKNGYEHAMKNVCRIISRPCTPSCHERTTITIQPGPHLIIECAVSTEKQRLSDFPVEVVLSGRKYVLGAGIMHVGTNHFVAFCRRRNGVWEIYNDLLPSVKIVDPSKVLERVQIVTYVAT